MSFRSPFNINILFFTLALFSCSRNKQLDNQKMNPTSHSTHSKQVSKDSAAVKKPTLDSITDQVTFTDEQKYINFAVLNSDAHFKCSKDLIVNSSNVSIIPNSNIIFSGNAPACQAIVTPLPGKSGKSTLTFAIANVPGSEISIHFEVKSVVREKNPEMIKTQTTSDLSQFYRAKPSAPATDSPEKPSFINPKQNEQPTFNIDKNPENLKGPPQKDISHFLHSADELKKEN